MAKPQEWVDWISKGDLDSVSKNLESDFLLDEIFLGHHLLWWAVDRQQLEIARFLLDQGADPDQEAPLAAAATLGDHKMIELLLSYQADVDQHGPFGDSPLRRAKDFPTLKLLLEAGANPDQQNDCGFTPLMAAVTLGEDAVKILLDYGADPNLATPQGTTALMIAATFGRTAEGRLLIQNGAEIDCWNESEELCALSAAMIQGSADFVAMLLDAGVDYVEVDNEYLRLTGKPLISLMPDDELGQSIARAILRRLDREPF